SKARSYPDSRFPCSRRARAALTQIARTWFTAMAAVTTAPSFSIRAGPRRTTSCFVSPISNSDIVLSMSQPVVEIDTNFGTFTIELLADSAPLTVENFLAYVDAGHYNGTIFHRVIPRFMAQGGGYSTGLEKKPTRASVRNEADNGLKNLRGTVAMARTSDPNSATAQFFVNLVDNAFLDHKDKSERGWGYTVFGRVTSGMEIVDQIATVKT